MANRVPEKTPLPPVTLILGGARSGKSAYGEALVEAQPGDCVYLATGQAGDDEMARRIAQHKARRGERWQTIEAPLALTEALTKAARPGAAVLVDCLTLWLSNLLLAGREPETETLALIDRLPRLVGPVVLIANEVGLGIVPENALARRFRDAAGRLNQAVAAVAGRVVLVTAGLPQILKNDAVEQRCPS
ncbi:MAG: bifunctional adenosylcobinamide kinase/adenosylcobinamide-phosphate guanylyltransferase [Alphaproteobacteria bacterium]|nr:bifunctional adenosylcobinamide kinase/adenosylcobinamide-phosphate guanylyltransferase [Alphaproteobacteria bacterium]